MKDNSPDEFTPQKAPARGPGGKFISTKKTTKSPVESDKKETTSKLKKQKKAKKVSKPKGPYTVPFSGAEIRRFYYEKKWYFSMKDLLSVGHSEPMMKPLKTLKKDGEVGKLLKEAINSFDKIECVEGNDAKKIISALISQEKATFPGSTLRWLDDISSLPFTITDESKIPPPQSLGNPSDRGS